MALHDALLSLDTNQPNIPITSATQQRVTLSSFGYALTQQSHTLLF
jgi:hypothetical protein